MMDLSVKSLQEFPEDEAENSSSPVRLFRMHQAQISDKIGKASPRREPQTTFRLGRRGSGISLDKSPSRMARIIQSRIQLSNISTEEMIKLRHFYDKHRGNEQHILLTTAHISNMLHRSGACSVPPQAEVARIVAKLQSADELNRFKGTAADAGVVADKSAPPLTFDFFCQAVELSKRWCLRTLEKEDNCSEAFSSLVQYGKAIRKGTIQLPENRTASLGSIPSRVNESDAMSNFSDERDEAISNAGSATTGSYRSGTINIKLLQELTNRVGLNYDFNIVFEGVDPKFDEHVTAKQFRWAAGSEDPDIVKAFVTLGGEQDLSGAIPVETLISKCSALGMTRQYIANFVAEVDANGDGFIDYSEFVAMVVRSRAERESDEGLTRAWSFKGPRPSVVLISPKRSARGYSISTTIQAKNRSYLAKEEDDDEEDAATAAPAFPRRSNFRRQSVASDPTPPFPQAAADSLEDTYQNEEIAKQIQDMHFDEDSMESVDGDTSIRPQLTPKRSTEDDVDSGFHAFEEPTNKVETESDSGSSSDLLDDDEEGVSSAPSSGKDIRRQNTLHNLDFGNLLKAGSQEMDKSEKTRQDEIDSIVAKGIDSVQIHRSRYNKYAEQVAAQSSRHHVRSEFGYIDVDKKHVGVLSQRQAIRVQLQERKRRKTIEVPKRLEAMRQSEVDQLRQHVIRSLEENRRLEETSAERQAAKERRVRQQQEAKKRKALASAAAVIACAALQYVASVVHHDPVMLRHDGVAAHVLKHKKHYMSLDATKLSVGEEMADEEDKRREEKQRKGPEGDATQQEPRGEDNPEAVSTPTGDVPVAAPETEPRQTQRSSSAASGEVSPKVDAKAAAKRKAAAALFAIAATGATYSAVKEASRKRQLLRPTRPKKGGKTEPAAAVATGTMPDAASQRTYATWQRSHSALAGGRRTPISRISLQTPAERFNMYIERADLEAQTNPPPPTTAERHARSSHRCGSCVEKRANIPSRPMTARPPSTRPATAGLRRPMSARTSRRSPPQPQPEVPSSPAHFPILAALGDEDDDPREATTVISGHVAADPSRSPLKVHVVTSVGTFATVVAADGKFRVSAPSGQHEVLIMRGGTAVGTTSVTVPVGAGMVECGGIELD